jgi:restriction system protein
MATAAVAPAPPSSIPDFQSLMLPVLEQAAEGEVRIGAIVERLADRVGLTTEQRSELLPSKRQTTFANRVHWAKSYLGKAGLIELTKRGHFQITDAGRQVLEHPPARIDINFLKRFPVFLAFRATVSEPDTAATDQQAESQLTPDEQMRQARDRIEADLGQDILAKLVEAPPQFFEKVVVKLLTAMGYGGSVSDAGRALGRSGDGGVDGVIDEDALGLDRIYVQAKRYKDGNPVGAGAIRDFFGALDQFKANKGLFVTTSNFTASASTTTAGLSKRIVLIDGQMLARLMIRYEVGCRVECSCSSRSSTRNSSTFDGQARSVGTGRGRLVT